MQRLLLDTHALIWWFAESEKLKRYPYEAIANSENEIFVSAISGLEIAIKSSLGKLKVPNSLGALVEEAGFTHLPVTFFHGEQAGHLPVYHRDPFDRILVAQAQVEKLILITRDSQIMQYDVSIIEA